MKRLLKVANDRMTYLKQMGFAPQVQPPKPTYVVRTESTPSNPVSPPRTTPSGNGQSPVRNDAAEQVPSPPAEESKNGLRYESNPRLLVMRSKNDAYEKMVAENVLDIS